MSTYTGVTYFEKTVWFLGHPVYAVYRRTHSPTRLVGLRNGSRLVLLYIHSSHKPCELSKWSPSCSAWRPSSTSFQNEEIQTKKFCRFWFNFMELAAVVIVSYCSSVRAWRPSIPPFSAELTKYHHSASMAVYAVRIIVRTPIFLLTSYLITHNDFVKMTAP